MQLRLRSLVVAAVGLAMLQARPVVMAGERPPADAVRSSSAPGAAPSWITQDLRLTGKEVSAEQSSSDLQVLIFQKGFSTRVAGYTLSADQAAVFLRPRQATVGGQSIRYYEFRAYLRGNLPVELSAGQPSGQVQAAALEDGRALIVRFVFSGEVFVTTDKWTSPQPSRSELYSRALAAFESIDRPALPAPGRPADEKASMEVVTPTEQAPKPSAPPQPVPVKPAPAGQTGPTPTTPPAANRSAFRGITLNVAPAGALSVQAERGPAPDGTNVITLIGGVYLWWEQFDPQSKQSYLLELRADNVVLWPSDSTTALERGPTLSPARLEHITAVYLGGDVVLTDGQRTISADEFYYDLEHNQGIALNTVFRTYEPQRRVPIYVRAAKFRQLARNHFEAERVTLTTSEFYVPQLSIGASRIDVFDNTAAGPQGTKSPGGGFDATLGHAAFRLYDYDLLRLPKVRTNETAPGTPLKGIRVGNDGTWGPSLETRWFLNRLLGLRQPEGTDSTLSLDYYGDRGPGAGFEVDYSRENYYGRILGYAIHDTGLDRLGRIAGRKDIEPPEETRGRFLFQHRQFLPWGWQLTAETSCLSDENFLEQYYRREFNTEKEQETLVHLKRITDNWGLALTGKVRINDFADQVEEAPTGELHWTGQSLLHDRVTFYSDSRVGRLRNRFGRNTVHVEPDEFYNFAATRDEFDVPLTLGPAKVVPFVAGTLAHDDGAGFYADLDGDTVSRQDGIWIGEAGVRAAGPSLWKVYPSVQSRLLDLNKLRHVVTPHLTAVGYAQGDAVAEQRDVLNLALSQKWQTKRGPAEDRRTVDWIRFDVDFTWVSNSDDDAAGGPDRFIWNKPFIPLVSTAPGLVPPQVAGLPPLDRRSSDLFGPTRNYIGADLIWQLSDSTAVVSDADFDMHKGVMQQFNIGFSRLCWPNLSYYVGTRYLRSVENGLGQKGSNAFTFAAAYRLDPRYTVVVSQQYDFEYGANINSDVSLIRKYHRVNMGLTFSVDETLDRQSIVFTLWPEGVPEMGMGLERQMGIDTAAPY